LRESIHAVDQDKLILVDCQWNVQSRFTVRVLYQSGL
jgi:hypothetical protein